MNAYHLFANIPLKPKFPLYIPHSEENKHPQSGPLYDYSKTHFHFFYFSRRGCKATLPRKGTLSRKVFTTPAEKYTFILRVNSWLFSESPASFHRTILLEHVQSGEKLNKL